MTSTSFRSIWIIILRMKLAKLKDEKGNRPIGINFPSTIDPCRLKYQEIELTLFPEQPSWGVT